MKSQDFAYWLQGFAEMNGDVPPTPEQWKMIKEHLDLVFNKVTPKLGEPAPIDPTKPFTPNWIHYHPPIFAPNEYFPPGTHVITC